MQGFAETYTGNIYFGDLVEWGAFLNIKMLHVAAFNSHWTICV